MTPLATSLLEGFSSPVTLDWAEANALSPHTKTNTPFALLQWLAASPNRKGVHIVLADAPDEYEPSAFRRKREQRKLRNHLLSMGCVVTARLKVS